MNKYRNTEDLQDGLPIYFKKWWLDLVHGKGKWEYIIETNVDGFIIAILPYAIKYKSFLRVITMHADSNYGGPYIVKDTQRKIDSQISHENRIIENLVNKLPDVDFIYFQCLPGLLSHLAFLWKKFTINITYTYRLTLDVDETILFNQLKGSTRTDIKKCQHDALKIEISNDDGIAFIDFLNEAFIKKRKENPYNLKRLSMIIKESGKRNSSFILFCKNGLNEIVAGVFITFDQETAYYYAGTNNNSKYGSASLSFCIWQAILFAKNKGIKTFDFEGSDIKGIEHFFRSFGGDLVPIYRIFKAKNRLGRILAYLQNSILFG